MYSDLNKFKYLIIGALCLTIASCSSGGSSSDSNTQSAGSSGGLRAVTLTWKAPTQYNDNTPLAISDIASYTLYYGTAPGMYTQTPINIPNPGSTPVSLTISLAPGTYYFVVSATDTLGYESAESSELSKTI